MLHRLFQYSLRCNFCIDLLVASNAPIDGLDFWLTMIWKKQKQYSICADERKHEQIEKEISPFLKPPGASEACYWRMKGQACQGSAQRIGRISWDTRLKGVDMMVCMVDCISVSVKLMVEKCLPGISVGLGGRADCKSRERVTKMKWHINTLNLPQGGRHCFPLVLR